MEFVPFAKMEFENLNEIKFFDKNIKVIKKYFSILEQQNKRDRPHLFYRIISSNNLVDELFVYKTQNDFWANNFSLPSFYKNDIPIVWFADLFIVVAIDEEQKKSFIDNGFDLKLCENQIYPTEEININDVEIQLYNEE